MHGVRPAWITCRPPTRAARGPKDAGQMGMIEHMNDNSQLVKI